MTNKKEPYDHQLLLNFLWQFHAFEEKLKKAGFRRVGRPEEADWIGFIGMVRAGEIEVTADEELDGAILHLSMQPLQGRRKNRVILHDISQVAEVLQERGRQFMRHPDIKNYSDEDSDMMVTGLVVMPAWSEALDHWLNRNRSA